MAGIERITRDGYSWNVGTEYDGDEFWRTYYVNGWEREQSWVLDQARATGGVFLDIGAWIGPWTLPALARGMTVDAYEPDHVAYARLQANLAANPWHATTTRSALSASAHNVTLTAQGDIWGGSNSGRWAEGALTLTAPAIPIGLVLDAHMALGPVFVKCDVEGDELDLFPVIASHHLPCHVSLHQPLARKAGDPVDFRTSLEPYFSRYGRLVVDGRREVGAAHVPYDRLCSVTCLEPRS